MHIYIIKYVYKVHSLVYNITCVVALLVIRGYSNAVSIMVGTMGTIFLQQEIYLLP